MNFICNTFLYIQIYELFYTVIMEIIVLRIIIEIQK